MKGHLILTGAPGVGKTTLIKKFIEGKEGLFGFITEEIREGGRRRGFKLITLSGEECILAHERLSSLCRVGKYGVDLSEFERVGVAEIKKGILQKAPFIVIDEIGKMELLSREFVKALFEAFESSRLIATMGKISHPVVRKIRSRKDVEIVEVTLKNRDFLIHQLNILHSSSPSV